MRLHLIVSRKVTAVLAAAVLLFSPCCCAGQQKEEHKQNEPQAQSEPEDCGRPDVEGAVKRAEDVASDEKPDAEDEGASTDESKPNGSAAPGKPPPAPPEDAREPNIAGGFTEIDVDRPEATESLEYLTDLLAQRFPGYTVTDVEKAEIQVVAGYNVRLTLSYNNGEGPGTLVAKVYTDLTGNRRLLDLLVDGENVIESVVPEG